MQAGPTGSAGPTGPAGPAGPTDLRGRRSRLGRRSLRSWSRWRVARGGRLARRGSRASGRSRSPETQPLDSWFEHRGRQTLRKNITLVECRLLIHDVAVVRSKRLADDAHGNPLGSRQVSQCRAVSRPNCRDTLSVIFAALEHDPTVHRFTEKLEQRKSFRLQCRSHADRLRLAGRRRGAALTLRAPGDRPAALAVGRLQFDPESGSRLGRFEVPGQVCIWGHDELEALLILDTKTADQLEISMMRNVLKEPAQRPVMALLSCRNFACKAGDRDKQVWPTQPCREKNFH